MIAAYREAERLSMKMTLLPDLAMEAKALVALAFFAMVRSKTCMQGGHAKFAAAIRKSRTSLMKR
jgi:hypothetical protein